MRVLTYGLLLMFAFTLGCGGETKAPPGAESSDTSLDVDMGDASSSPTEDSPADETPAEKS